MAQIKQDPDDPTERTSDAAMSPKQRRARRRSLASGNANPDDPPFETSARARSSGLTRDVLARADADFERIFGSK